MKRTAFLRKTPLKKVSPNKVKRKKSEVSKLKKKLWELCRKIIKGQHRHNCFTCGMWMMDGSQNFHVGHFISSSICSTELRYDLDNLRPQCSGCNIWRSGNWIEFEKNLIRDHGEQYVIDLKSRNEKTKGRKYDELWYLQKIAEYEAILKQLCSHE